MEELQKEGLARNIGCCNIGVALLRDVMNYCTVKPTVLQVEIHPICAQQRLVRFCKENNVCVTAYSSFGA